MYTAYEVGLILGMGLFTGLILGIAFSILVRKYR